MKNKITLEDIQKQVQKNFEEQIEFLRAMVKIDSINYCNDTGGQTAVESELARLIKYKLLSLNVGARYLRARKNRPNVLSVWGPARARKSLALVGHMDCEKPLWGDKQVWFSGQIGQGKLFGAGALDMKGSLSVYIYAMKALIDLGVEPNGQLKLAFTVDGKKGKTSNLGLKFLVKKGFRASAAILAKPGMDKVAIGHRGGYRFRIITHGESVNTGRRAWEEGRKGKNAIVDMFRIIKKLSNFDLPYRPAKAFPNRLPVFTFPTVVAGGKSVDTVPDRCEAWGDVRLLPGNTDIQVKMWIEEKLSEFKDISWELSDELYAPSMEIERTNKLVQIVADQVNGVMGAKPRLEGCGPWNEAWILTSEADTPCIAGFGPDGQDGADPNEQEWVDIESLKKVTEIYARIIWKYLGDMRDKGVNVEYDDLLDEEPTAEDLALV